MMDDISVDIKSLSKSYINVLAIQDMTIQIGRGELFGLIGPDGAGKTSLFRILTTLLLPDAGSASVEGFDVVSDYRDIRKITGYMPGRFSLYQDLTVEENLKFYATVFGTTIEKNYDLVRDIYSHIEPFKKRRAGRLSGGMKQKLALSCALIHKPRVLVLDEPTTGVDAVSRKEFWDMLLRLRGKDISILVSTPYMDEAALCDRVALIQGGRLLSVDTPAAIIGAYGRALWAVSAADLYRLKQDLGAYAKTRSVFLFGRDLHLSLRKEEHAEKDLEVYLKEKGHADIRISRIKAGIEDCFMELMTKDRT
jgi:ABC-type multidrug transport system ATPase subunit